MVPESTYHLKPLLPISNKDDLAALFICDVKLKVSLFLHVGCRCPNPVSTEGNEREAALLPL